MAYNFYDSYEYTKPIQTDEGIKARSKRGDFTKSWWAKRWIEALEKITASGRLSRGRTYARKGQVLSLEDTSWGIVASVQGSSYTPYEVEIALKPLTDKQWDKVLDAMSERAILSAQLLAGEMPQDIEEAFSAAQVSLFPEKRRELETNCSCPDPSNPCKHVAAVHYILGEQFDEDPFLIFKLRGRTQEEIAEALGHRSAEADGALELAEEQAEYITEEPAIPLEETLEYFWDLGQSVEQIATSIREPVTSLSVLRRLGQPGFMNESLMDLLGPLYEKTSENGLKAGYQNQSPAD
ncbi:MAG: SWIM zinc finger family protein [Chloroflexota bacterium]